MKAFYFTLLVLWLAACGDTSPQPVQKETLVPPAEQQNKQAQIENRLQKEEYFIGENNLEKIQQHSTLKERAQQMLAVLADAEKESRTMVLNGENLAEVKTFNEALIAVTKAAEESFGGPFLADKAGLYQCTNAANAAYDYFVARQNQAKLIGNYKQSYDDAVAACSEQINNPPQPEATVYARKGIKLPLNGCLSVLTGNEPFDTFTCPMQVK